MTAKVCLRCDWSGVTTDDACPRCGAGLFASAAHDPGGGRPPTGRPIDGAAHGAIVARHARGGARRPARDRRGGVRPAPHAPAPPWARHRPVARASCSRRPPRARALGCGSGTSATNTASQGPLLDVPGPTNSSTATKCTVVGWGSRPAARPGARLRPALPRSRRIGRCRSRRGMPSRGRRAPPPSASCGPGRRATARGSRSAPGSCRSADRWSASTVSAAGSRRPSPEIGIFPTSRSSATRCPPRCASAPATWSRSCPATDS